MADNAAMTLKILFMWLYCSIFTPLAEVIVTASGDKPHDIVFYFFIFMIFLPELTAIVSRSFRMWIKSGIEDGDGNLNKQDLKDFIMHLGALYALRIFVLMGLSVIFFEIEIPFEFYIIPFLGSMGLEGLNVVINYLRNKRNG